MEELTGEKFGSLVYLGLLGAALVVWFLASNRQRANKVLQQLVVWALIFIGVMAAYGMWEDIRGAALPRQTIISDSGIIEVPRGRDGHYHVTAYVNDTPIRFIVDTGATGVVLRQSDAEAAGIDVSKLAFLGRAQTANGTVNIARTRVDSFGLQGAEINRFNLDVNEGDLFQSLMGMSYLNHFNKIEISGGKLLLHP